MDKSSKEFINKRNSLLKLLKYIDEQKIWNTAKYLIEYIDKTGNTDLELLNLITNLINEAINDAKNTILINEKNKICNILDKLKEDEKISNYEDNIEIDNLLKDLNK